MSKEKPVASLDDIPEGDVELIEEEDIAPGGDDNGDEELFEIEADPVPPPPVAEPEEE